jgi:glycosyltransferase involved in cell wall biosynthesis
MIEGSGERPPLSVDNETRRIDEGDTTGPLRSCVLFHEGPLQGAGVAVARVLPGLRELGWAPYAWFPYEGPIQQAIEPLVDGSRFRQGYFAFSVSGWRLSPGVARRLAGLPGYFWALRSMLAELRPDVVHANTLLSLPEAAVAHRMGLPVVLHMHELPPPGRKTDLTLRAVAAVADVVVTVSDAVQALFAPYAGSTTAVRVYNGLPEEAFANPKVAQTSDRLLVGTVGGATFRKGIDLFLDAAKEVLTDCTDVDFLHVGPEPWEVGSFADAIAARVRAFPEGRLTMAGVRPAAEPLRSMDVFVMASRQEPFGLASLEAMAAGVPVIAASVGGLPEQIEHLKSGILVPPEDPQAIALWIRRLRDDPDLRHSLGKAGRVMVKERFPLELQCSSLDAAYRDAIALHHGGGIPDRLPAT